jgi:hypothetical protein
MGEGLSLRFSATYLSEFTCAGLSGIKYEQATAKELKFMHFTDLEQVEVTQAERTTWTHLELS